MTKPRYRMTEIGEIPEEWKIDKVSNLKESMHYGITAKSTEQRSHLRFLRTTDISNFNFDPNDLHYCEITGTKPDLSKYYLKQGDIIVARAGTVGVSVLVKRDLPNTIFGSYLIKIAFNKDLIYANFVHYYFQSDIYWNKLRAAQGSTIKNISLPFLKALLLPVPPLQEQQKIAEILSTADETIQKVDEEITLTEKLKKGLMQTLLTKGIGHTKFKMTEIGEIPEEWGTSELRKAFKIITGTTPSTKIKKYWTGGTLEWLTPKDLSQMNDNLIISPSERKVTSEALNESNLNLLPEGSILISTRAPVGYVGINRTPITFNQGCKGLVPLLSEGYSSFFYAYYLKYKREFLNSVSSGSTFKELSKERLERLVVPIPPRLEQQKISEILTTIDHKLELLRSKKTHLEELKKGMMEELLTGRVRVKI